MASASQSTMINKANTFIPSYPLSPTESAESILIDNANDIPAFNSTVENTLYQKLVKLNPEYDECSPFFICDVGEEIGRASCRERV